MPDRRRTGGVERRALDRVAYRRTAPGLLELEGHRCAVRDLGPGGLRIEPAPPGRVWQKGERVMGSFLLRSGERIEVDAVIGRIDRGGVALFPEGGQWPTPAEIEAERASLAHRRRERRAAARLAMPRPTGGAAVSTPLRDVSATGLRYMLTANESAPAVGSRIEGVLRLDAATSIDVCGQVVRHSGREIAVAFDPPGLAPAVLALLQKRFFSGR